MKSSENRAKERLDRDAGLQQDVVDNVRQSEFRVEEVTSAPPA
jgi:hypothetical protein